MQFLESLYAPFFHLANWKEALCEPSDWMIIFTLVIMECLLSVDNAVVLAAQTKQLPTEKEQQKSLIYGLWGAYLFRFIIIGLGAYLIHMEWIKILGAAYLFYLAIRHLYEIKKGKHEEEEIHVNKVKSSGNSVII